MNKQCRKNNKTNSAAVKSTIDFVKEFMVVDAEFFVIALVSIAETGPIAECYHLR